ncbi:MAG: CoA transferase [Chloroflexota bacterium]
MDNNVLTGYRVLDFGRFIAAPYCGTLLAQMGAEVIRIERPGGSEDRYLAPITDKGEGGMYMQVNSDKLGMTLHIAKPEGRKIVKELVATADVVIANLPPKTLQALELDYDSLTKIKPDIILAENTTFGSHSPYANKVGFDGVAQAMSGAIFMSGTPNQPVRTAVPYLDFSSALSSALGIVAALMVRERTGEGQIVSTSLLGTALMMSNSQLIEQAVIEANRVPTGNQGQIAAPADIFPTQDGHLIIQVVGPYIFKRWAQLMGEEEKWLNDPRFKDDISRGDHSGILNARTAEWTSTRTTEQALAELEAARVPAGPVLAFQQTLDHPYVDGLGALKPTEYPGAERAAPIANLPFRLSKTAVGMKHRAPTVGEHTNQILHELGYDNEAITALRKSGIV